MPHLIPAAVPPRKVVVVGGGPAGLEAARVLGERGHRVVLFEAAPRLGGQVCLAQAASWRKDVMGIIDWRARELERLAVEVRLNVYAEAGEIDAESPEVVIIATGGLPDLDWLPGCEHVNSPWDVLSGEARGTGDAIVYDGTGRHSGATVAEALAMAGRSVTFFHLDESVAPELAYSERVIWKKRIYELGIPSRFDQRLVAVEKSGNQLSATFSNEITGTVEVHACSQIIVEHGTKPMDGVYEDLRSRSRNLGVTDNDALLAGTPQHADQNSDGVFELYRIGDCVSSRNIAAAVYDALRLCLRV